MTDYFTTPQNHRLAYHKIDGGTDKPGFVWLSGFNSDMAGTKVTALKAWAKETGHNFLAFDYSGHGLSDGDFIESTISDWRADTLSVIDALTAGPQILIGSSMGGWLALLAALARPRCIAGLVLIAPAPDFTERLIWPRLSPEAQAEIIETGVHMHPSEYDEPYPLTAALFEDARQWLLLDTPIPFAGPVRILQGQRDEDVPSDYAERLARLITSDDLTFTLVDDGDHRLSRPEDIDLLISICTAISSVITAKHS